MGVKVKEKVAGSGVFWVFINHKGKRKSKCVGSVKAALEVKAIIEGKLKLGQPLPKEEPPAPKLSAYFEKFSRNYLETALRYSARLRHQSNFNIHILPALGHLRLDEITREKMQEFIAALVTKELSKDSIRLALAAVRVLFNYAIDNKVVTENPVVRLSKYYSQVKRVRDEIDPLTAEEVSLFLQTVLNSKYYREYYPVLLCAIHAGLRAGELTALQWGDVDFNGKFLTVRRNIVHKRVNLPKNGKARRVDMSDALAEALQELKKARKEAWLAKGQNEIPEWVFCNFEGKLLDTNNLRNRALHKCLENAKLRTIRLHDLRHTFASLLIQNGESLAYVKDQMGHSSIKVTVDIYGHLVPGANRQAVNRLPTAHGVPKRKGKKNLA
ncbi:MAG: site-specific integrase [Acidobacteria bacterium]|nr:site-specific integrase [Acidobacteriota bacterium]MCI0718136.1 site-specific integrase [Acidobacteriota bacterium]